MTPSAQFFLALSLIFALALAAVGLSHYYRWRDYLRELQRGGRLQREVRFLRRRVDMLERALTHCAEKEERLRIRRERVSVYEVGPGNN